MLIYSQMVQLINKILVEYCYMKQYHYLVLTGETASEDRKAMMDKYALCVCVYVCVCVCCVCVCVRMCVCGFVSARASFHPPLRVCCVPLQVLESLHAWYADPSRDAGGTHQIRSTSSLCCRHALAGRASTCRQQTQSSFTTATGIR